jgi:hypothetical protein
MLSAISFTHELYLLPFYWQSEGSEDAELELGI